MAKPKAQRSTGIMNKMRDKMPIIIIFLIVAFLGTIIFIRNNISKFAIEWWP